MYAHLALAVSSYLLCAGGLAFLQPDASTHLLPQPLIFHSHHLGNRHSHETCFLTTGGMASVRILAVWRLSASLQWFWVSPARPVLCGGWGETALSQRGRCSPLHGWSCPSSALQCGNILDCSDWQCRCVKKANHKFYTGNITHSNRPLYFLHLTVHTQSCTSELRRWSDWFSQDPPSIQASHSSLWSSAHLGFPEGQCSQQGPPLWPMVKTHRRKSQCCGDVQIKLGMKYKGHLRVVHYASDCVKLQVVRVLRESQKCNRAVLSRPIK